MEPLNKEERQKAILKASIWTVLAGVVMFMGLKSYFDANSAIQTSGNNAAKEYEQIIKIRDDFQNRFAVIDSLYFGFDKSYKAYLKELQDKMPDPSYALAGNYKKQLLAQLDSIEILNQKNEMKAVYASLVSEKRKVISVKDGLQRVIENPPSPDCSICPFDVARCPPAPAAVPCPPCPTTCQDNVSRFRIRIEDAMENAFGNQISKNTVRQIIRDFLSL